MDPTNRSLSPRMDVFWQDCVPGSTGFSNADEFSVPPVSRPPFNPGTPPNPPLEPIVSLLMKKSYFF
jgi:hypothetical protein